MNSSTKGEKVSTEPQAIAVLTESSDSEQHHRQNTKNTGSPEAKREKPGDQEEPGHQEGGWRDTTVQQSHLLLIPKFVLSYNR